MHDTWLKSLISEYDKRSNKQTRETVERITGKQQVNGDSQFFVRIIKSSTYAKLQASSSIATIKEIRAFKQIKHLSGFARNGKKERERERTPRVEFE